MSKHAGTIIGAVLLVGLVLVVVATQSGRDGHHDVVLSIAVASPAGSAFNPSTGNTVTTNVASIPTRSVSLNFTAKACLKGPGGSAGQVAEFGIFDS